MANSSPQRPQASLSSRGWGRYQPDSPHSRHGPAFACQYITLLEQPELHLHPSVQARLGDFFMGLAKCKKQCLIETHSEIW